jgi:hypothetical protein
VFSRYNPNDVQPAKGQKPADQRPQPPKSPKKQQQQISFLRGCSGNREEDIDNVHAEEGCDRSIPLVQIPQQQVCTDHSPIKDPVLGLIQPPTNGPTANQPPSTDSGRNESPIRDTRLLHSSNSLPPPSHAPQVPESLYVSHRMPTNYGSLEGSVVVYNEHGQIKTITHHDMNALYNQRPVSLKLRSSFP